MDEEKPDFLFVFPHLSPKGFLGTRWLIHREKTRMRMVMCRDKHPSGERHTPCKVVRGFVNPVPGHGFCCLAFWADGGAARI